MPSKDYRTRVNTVAVKGRMPSSGRLHVSYRDANGKSLAATVIASGSVSGLKLNIDTHVSTRIIDNVPAQTTLKGTGVYTIRHQ